MASNLLDDTIEGVFQAILDPAPDELLIVNPSVDAIDALGAVVDNDDVPELPQIRLLGDESTLKTVRSNLTLASTLATLIEDDTLTIRALPAYDHDYGYDIKKNSLLVLPTEVVTHVTAGDTIAGLSTDDEEFVAAAHDVYMSAWEDADDFDLRTPSFSRIRTTLADEISEPVEADFTGVLASLATARGDGDDNGGADDGLDEVAISLLVAAKHEVQLYDISNWGEDVGLASRAKFSQTKGRLEDKGLLDTEKVPVDVGRPRLRLQLGDERLNEASTDQLASVAQTLLT